MVLGYHLVANSNIRVWFDPQGSIVWRVSQIGRYGVYIFFCISGFVICRGLMRELAQTSSISLKAFYIRRGLRILPPLLLYLASLALLSRMGQIEVAPLQLLASAVFLCNSSFLANCGWFAGHTWSLAYEEQFYLVFPLLFIAAGLARRPGRLWLVVLSLVALGLILKALSFVLIPDYLHNVTYLLTGCLVALHWDCLASRLHLLPGWLWPATTVLTMVLVGGLAFPPWWEAYLIPVLLPLLTCFMVLATPASQPAMSKYFQHPIASHLGKTSYTVYLWQQLATGYFPGMSPWWTVALVMGVWAIAHLSYKYIEQPLMKVGADWTNWIKSGQPHSQAAQ